MCAVLRCFSIKILGVYCSALELRGERETDAHQVSEFVNFERVGNLSVLIELVVFLNFLQVIPEDRSTESFLVCLIPLPMFQLMSMEHVLDIMTRHDVTNRIHNSNTIILNHLEELRYC